MTTTSALTSPRDRHDRLRGLLLGTAIGDALGLSTEGLSARGVKRRGLEPRYRLLPGVGLVSDDTEQAALVATSLAAHPGDPDAIIRSFRTSMKGWFLRLPWGLGWATLRACVRLLLGVEPSGVRSAGNGAAMRAAVVGAFLDGPDEASGRHALGRALARVTHTDERAIDGALYVAEVVAVSSQRPGAAAAEVAREALAVVGSAELRAAIERALSLAARGASVEEAAGELGNTGFVLHTVPLCAFVLAAAGDRAPLDAVTATIAAGGDTDSTAAIVGAWVGARRGSAGWPPELVAGLQGGPFGADLDELAVALDEARRDGRGRVVRFAWPLAMLRNVALYPVVLVQGVRIVLGR